MFLRSRECRTLSGGCGIPALSACPSPCVQAGVTERTVLGQLAIACTGEASVFDRDHFYLTFGGTSFGVTEIWQTGFRLAGDPTYVAADYLNALSTIDVSDILTAFGSVIATTTIGLTHPSSLALTWAKLAVIKKDGKYAGSPKIAEGMYKGTAGAASPSPPQLAWAVTLETGKSFGMAQKGRMYWPVPPTVVATLDSITGQTGAGYDTQFRDKIITAFNAAEGEVSTALLSTSACVMSKSGGVTAPQAPGTTNWVTALSVGRALDTMRSRRGNIADTRTPAPASRGVRGSQHARPGWTGLQSTSADGGPQTGVSDVV